MQGFSHALAERVPRTDAQARSVPIGPQPAPQQAPRQAPPTNPAEPLQQQLVGKVDAVQRELDGLASQVCIALCIACTACDMKPTATNSRFLHELGLWCKTDTTRAESERRNSAPFMFLAYPV